MHQALHRPSRTFLGPLKVYGSVRSAWRRPRDPLNKHAIGYMDGGFPSAFPSPQSKLRLTSRAYSTLPVKLCTPSPTVKAKSRVCRVVETLSPQRLISTNHPIIDISGSERVTIIFQDKAKTSSRVGYHRTKEQGLFKHVPFPPNTVGVFYYRQSQTFPTRLGELRFRLCPDISDFEQGDDLCYSSGDIWHLSSRCIYLGSEYRAIHQRLTNEGLLERQMYPGIPDSMLRGLVIPLTSLHQPFVVDLNARTFTPSFVTLHSPPTVLGLPVQNPFRDISMKYKKDPLLSGRAVVQLEPYPTSALPERTKFNPLLTLRCLELLTPVKRLSDSDSTLAPVPGQLFMRRHRNLGHIPWFLSPSKSTRKAVTDWINTQSQLSSF